MLRRYICLTRSSDLSFASNFFGNDKFLCNLGRLDGSINKIKLVGRDTASLIFWYIHYTIHYFDTVLSLTITITKFSNLIGYQLS